MTHDDPILTEKEVAAWLGLSIPSLQRMRSDGSGPPFVQLSQRRIGYRNSAVERWLEERTITRVGEPVGTTSRGKPSLPRDCDAANGAPHASSPH
jgi:predicted DNA-binding transcriptional regulator AlpA